MQINRYFQTIPVCMNVFSKQISQTTTPPLLICNNTINSDRLVFSDMEYFPKQASKK